jgi:hypothetical protein
LGILAASYLKTDYVTADYADANSLYYFQLAISNTLSKKKHSWPEMTPTTVHLSLTMHFADYG